MFNLFKKTKLNEIRCCIEGQIVPLSRVNDPMFSQEMIGKGIAILPSGHTVVSPANGKIAMIFPTNHALGLTLDNGLEILIHIGIDTVKLKGNGFKRLVEEGAEVKAGQPLIEVDFKTVTESGYAPDTLMIVTSAKESYSIDYPEFNQKVSVKDPAFTLNKL